ncbi:hypothetical protein AVEN_136917-1 [Araneus ventricosus]|uniref:Uncharacterized protein n=1 Tax=Araneus ventricosus TaxID=182803 RepID=A0A4Y2BGM0_ARAVE|nr:hypothetical protein AVEN_136917-1 [Araneus ventricosus]
MIVRAVFGGGVLAWPGDGLLGLRPQYSSCRNDYCLSESRKLRQGGVIRFSGYGWSWKETFTEVLSTYRGMEANDLRSWRQNEGPQKY